MQADNMKIVEQINYILNEIRDLDNMDDSYFVLEETHVDKIINVIRVVDSLRPLNNNYDDLNIIALLTGMPEIKVKRNLLESNYYDEETGSMIFIDVFIKLRKQWHLRQINRKLKQTDRILQIVKGMITQNIN
jgi:hypothetical protein